MAKTSEIPAELRGFNTLFETLTYRYTHDAQAFDDFLSYSVACFLTTGDADLVDRLKKTYGKDYGTFDALFREWIAIQDRMIMGDGTSWYDALGNFYEAIASRSKSSRLGQFFTPETVCDMMVLINGLGPEQKGRGLTVADPCSGSGRMLVATHVRSPGNRQYGADLDPMCCKMTALNMLVHGCVGEAVCMNSLTMEWRFGYGVNYHLARMGVPTIMMIEQSESYIGRVPIKPVQESSTTTPPVATGVVTDVGMNVDKRGQLILF